MRSFGFALIAALVLLGSTTFATSITSGWGGRHSGRGGHGWRHGGGHGHRGGRSPHCGGPRIPEPATMTLVGLGMLGAAGYRTWKRRRQ